MMKNVFTVGVLMLVVGFGVGFVVNTPHNYRDDDLRGKNDRAGYGMHNMMMDMNMNLTGKSGDELDKAFLAEMIVHHEGALKMAALVATSSARAELRAFAQSIITAQQAEITQMKAWQNEWFGTPSNVPPKKPVEAVACTMDAKMCPDGSYVGRTGPNCEFSPCPGVR